MIDHTGQHIHTSEPLGYLDESGETAILPAGTPAVVAREDQIKGTWQLTVAADDSPTGEQLDIPVVSPQQWHPAERTHRTPRI
jgi:hypothetical protein